MAKKLEIEELELLLGPEGSEVNLRYILRNASRRGGMIFEIFSSKVKSEHLFVSKVRWDERQRLKVAQGGKARRDVQEVDDEVDQSWTAACEWTAKKVLMYWEDSEVLKVSTGEMKEQVLSQSDEARSEKSKKLFQSFTQGVNEVLIASVARWEEPLKGLVVLERHCLALREEVEHSNERQEVLAVLMAGKMNMQKTAPEDFQRQIFQELRELEEQKTKDTLELVQRKAKLIKWEGERERARTLQRLESSRAARQWSGVHHNSSLGSCSSSLAFDTDEAMSASSQMEKDADEAMSESSWTAQAKGKERDWWSIDREGDMEKLEVVGLGPGLKADPWISKGRWATGQLGQKLKEAEMEVDGEPQEESVEIQGPKRKVIGVESEETQDYVRETLASSQEEAEKMGIVPSALREPRGPFIGATIDAVKKPSDIGKPSMVVEERNEAHTIN